MATHSSILTWKIPWTEKPGRLHSPWGRKELDMTKQLHFHFHSVCQALFYPLPHVIRRPTMVLTKGVLS